MHGVIEMVCAIVASLAAAVFAQFGVTLHAHPPVERPPVQDVHRTASSAAGPGQATPACRPPSVCLGGSRRRG